jgi:hypothetical protein
MKKNTDTTFPNILWISFNYSMKSNNTTLVISTISSDHQMTMQYNFREPYFISGIRICFAADGRTNDVNTLQQLDFYRL